MLKPIILGCGLSLISLGAAFAVPVVRIAPSEAPIVRTEGGCGPAYHRNRFGYCVQNFYYGGPVRLPPPCPRFYHRDPDPARPICYPN